MAGMFACSYQRGSLQAWFNAFLSASDTTQRGNYLIVCCATRGSECTDFEGILAISVSWIPQEVERCVRILPQEALVMQVVKK